MVILKASKGTHFIAKKKKKRKKNELIPFSQTDVLGQSPELKCLEQNEKSATLARGWHYFIYSIDKYLSTLRVYQPLH